MKKLLRPQDILLLTLAGGLDAFIEIKNEPMATACKNLYGWIPPRYQKSDFLQTVYHSLRTGYIQKVIKGGEVYLRLTPKGEGRLKRDFSLSSWQRRKWDRRWRVVIFDIAEVNKKIRDNFRAKLQELGFGMLQESVWISPYDFVVDFQQFIQSQALKDNVLIFETSSVLSGNERELAAKIWSLENINEEYGRLLEDLIKLRGRGKMSSEERGEIRTRYLAILREDPCLPQELLPTDWYREKLERTLRQLGD